MRMDSKVRFNNPDIGGEWCDESTRNKYVKKEGCTGIVIDTDEDDVSPSYFVLFDDGTILYLFSDEVELVEY